MKSIKAECHKAHADWCPSSQKKGKTSDQIRAAKASKKAKADTKQAFADGKRPTQAALNAFFGVNRALPTSPRKDSRKVRIAEVESDVSGGALEEKIRALRRLGFDTIRNPYTRKFYYKDAEGNSVNVTADMDLPTEVQPIATAKFPEAVPPPGAAGPTTPTASPTKPAGATLKAAPQAAATPIAATKKPATEPIPDFTAAYIKNLIAEGMNGEFPKGLQMPKQLYCVVNYINSNSPKSRAETNELITGDRAIENNRKIDWWGRTFGQGNIKFTIPADERGPSNPIPDPLYHSLEGVNIYLPKWDLAFPGMKLECWQDNCDGEMIRGGKMDLGKPGSHIVDSIGSRNIAFFSNYKCNTCNHQCSAVTNRSNNK